MFVPPFADEWSFRSFYLHESDQHFQKPSSHFLSQSLVWAHRKTTSRWRPETNTVISRHDRTEETTDSKLKSTADLDGEDGVWQVLVGDLHGCCSSFGVRLCISEHCTHHLTDARHLQTSRNAHNLSGEMLLSGHSFLFL